jgi:hypothetical protein
VRLVADEGDNHTVEIEEEHQQVETKLDERFLLVHIKLPEDLCRIQEMLVLEDSASVSARSWPKSLVACTYFLPFQASRGRLRMSAIQYPLIRKSVVRKAWTAASGMMYVFRRLQRSMGLM